MPLSPGVERLLEILLTCVLMGPTGMGPQISLCLLLDARLAKINIRAMIRAE